jgi:hypothetical protein
MNQTRNKKTSRRKSRKITGGENPAKIFFSGTEKSRDELKKQWLDIKELVKLDNHKVQYMNVEYKITEASPKKIVWNDLTDTSNLKKSGIKNIKYIEKLIGENKKKLIGDAISKIYFDNKEPTYFEKDLKKLNKLNKTLKLDSNTISQVQFEPKKVIVTYEPTNIQTLIIPDPGDWQQKVLDYYLNTINVTSRVSSIGRTITSVTTGTTNIAQLQAEKVQRIPTETEIKEAFGVKNIKKGWYNAVTGELSFKGKVLTDGNKKYTVSDLKIGCI